MLEPSTLKFLMLPWMTKNTIKARISASDISLKARDMINGVTYLVTYLMNSRRWQRVLGNGPK